LKLLNDSASFSVLKHVTCIEEEVFLVLKVALHLVELDAKPTLFADFLS